MTKLELLNKASKSSKAMTQITTLAQFYKFTTKRVGWEFFKKVLNNEEFDADAKTKVAFETRLAAAKKLVQVWNSLSDEEVSE